MDEALRYLEAGEIVGIFPEATISRSFEVKELKSGATRIAAAAGVPLVPVALWGTQRLMTKDHPKDFSRGKTISIAVGEPLHPSGEDPVAETAEPERAATAVPRPARAHTQQPWKRSGQNTRGFGPTQRAPRKVGGS